MAVTVRKLPDGRVAIDCGKPGPFVVLTVTQLTAVLRGVRDTGIYAPFAVRRP